MKKFEEFLNEHLEAWEVNMKILALANQFAKEVKNETIEECAKVADNYAEETFNNYEPRDIAKLIREQKS